MHLAELNIARLLAPTDDPRVAEFMANLDRINGMGKRMPGFVWISRLSMPSSCPVRQSGSRLPNLPILSCGGSKRGIARRWTKPLSVWRICRTTALETGLAPTWVYGFVALLGGMGLILTFAFLRKAKGGISPTRDRKRR